MPSSKVDLKNRWLAAVLAFLVPGAGHFYQGRHFKAVIYSIGVIGLFAWGLGLGECKVVYWRWESGSHRTFGYLAQVLVGLPALPAVWQSKRYEVPPDDNRGRFQQRLRLDRVPAPEETLEASFRGRLRLDPEEVPIHPVDERERAGPPIHEVQGTIRWQWVFDDAVGEPVFEGTFNGTRKDGQTVMLTLIREPTVSPRVFVHSEITPKMLVNPGENLPQQFASHRRYLRCDFREGEQEGTIEGSVPRRFSDWFQVPLEEKALRDLHRRLGRRFELAQVFTWIAGLLNLLAIWDALEGPAYGYGDEEEENEDSSKPDPVSA